MFDYQLIRSHRRKSLTIQIKQGQMTVRAPNYLPLSEIEGFIKRKSAWLEKKLTAQQTLLQNKVPLFTYQSKLFYFGQTKTLLIEFAAKPTIEISEQTLTVVLSYRQQKQLVSLNDITKVVKQALAKYFKQQLSCYLSANIPILSQQLQLFPLHYQVRFYKTRWGSCNSRHELSFNYLLIMAPKWVINYVIVHELCHLKHLNHSANFWLLVAKYQPHYKQAKAWLKAHQIELSWL
ncbi:MAG: hypothetical protein COB35_01955 [Gammaproteobacteria bacterium]|nr:MAG: hypothetical protein COB35_01955 [Gammaproteobacteria bacterium]